MHFFDMASSSIQPLLVTLNPLQIDLPMSHKRHIGVFDGPSYQLSI